MGHFHRSGGLLKRVKDCNGRNGVAPAEMGPGVKSITITGLDLEAGRWVGWIETEKDQDEPHRAVHDRGGNDEPRPR